MVEIYEQSGSTATRSCRIEDGLAEDDGTGGGSLTARSAAGCNSWATTSSSRTSHRLRRGIDEGVANAVLIKLNQIGTLTETLDACALAHSAGYRTVISHR